MKKHKSIESTLVAGEHIVERAQIHAGIYWQSVAVLALAIWVGVFVAAPLGVLLLVTSSVMCAYAAIRQKILFLVLTNKRILVRTGLLQVDVVDIRLSKVESIETERMITGFLMGYANLVIMGTGQRYITVPYVGNAAALRQAYNRLTLEEQKTEV